MTLRTLGTIRTQDSKQNLAPFKSATFSWDWLNKSDAGSIRHTMESGILEVIRIGFRTKRSWARTPHTTHHLVPFFVAVPVVYERPCSTRDNLLVARRYELFTGRCTAARSLIDATSRNCVDVDEKNSARLSLYSAQAVQGAELGVLGARARVAVDGVSQESKVLVDAVVHDGLAAAMFAL
jgi:hypothetical protein